jgi:hypothetical protein
MLAGGYDITRTRQDRTAGSVHRPVLPVIWMALITCRACGVHDAYDVVAGST